jgi:hypothetical protein
MPFLPTLSALAWVSVLFSTLAYGVVICLIFWLFL